jgi:hypothetical protein
MVAVMAFDTVTEAVVFLTSCGYSGDGAGLDPVVDYLFRFEGPSDPADEAIVMGVRDPVSGARGMVVSGFGPTAD